MNIENTPIPASHPTPPPVVRPWGQFWQYAHNERCTVSLMEVKPGQRLSLQSHTGRAELWIVLDAGARIQNGEHVADYAPGDEVWIPPNGKHRLTCVGPKPCRVLEVAFGQWEQADITRYEDDFQRPATGE